MKTIVTLGDPAGIGTEVVLKALTKLTDRQLQDLAIIGNRRLLLDNYRSLCQQNLELINLDRLTIIDVPLADEIISGVETGVGNAASGAASFAYLKQAIDLTLAGKFRAIVTAPIAKSAWLAAGHHYPGQTELLATSANIQKYGMFFIAKSPHTGWLLRALLATTHIPLNEVSQTLTPELLTAKLELIVQFLERDCQISHGKIAIAGLNPHSGEGGQLGTEERDWIDDWLVAQRRRYPHHELQGLLPPDTMWVNAGRAWYRGRKDVPDAYLALYHDQGLIPVKLMAFDRAVNTTIGLPFVRTSPDHGTAFDIAGRGIADSTSMSAAIELVDSFL
jgi:4-hydroxythreonine-4-phosphate dehydrogenase